MLYLEKLPWPKIGAGTKIYTLSGDLRLDQWTIPEDTIVQLRQTENFGWVILAPGTKDKDGNVIPRRIFRY